MVTAEKTCPPKQNPDPKQRLRRRIKKTYDRHAQNYDADTQLQRSLADKLADVVHGDGVGAIHELPLQILDVGCGTGHLAQAICRGGPLWPPNTIEVGTGACPYVHFVGCDISFGMLSRARDKGGRYVQSDASVLPFADSVFELVVSNAAYQWVLDLVSAFREVNRVLKDDGKFYFTIFNKNTLWQLQSVCKEINIASSTFPDKDKLSSALAEAGFSIDSIETFRYEKYYKDLWQLLGALKNIGSTSADNKIKGLGWRKILRQANGLYTARFANENGIPATYEAFLIRADKG